MAQLGWDVVTLLEPCQGPLWELGIILIKYRPLSS